VGSIPVQSNARWKWCQSHARLDSYTQFWFKKNKKIQAAKWGTPKKIFKKKKLSFSKLIIHTVEKRNDVEKNDIFENKVLRKQLNA